LLDDLPALRHRRARAPAGLEDPRRLARRAGCRWGAGAL